MYNVDTLWYHFPPQIVNPEKILGLDLDGTIIKTKSGKISPTDYTDFYVVKGMKDRLVEKIGKGYTLVIFSNQYEITKKGHDKVLELEKKMNLLSEELGLSLNYFFAGDKDKYRKPAPYMFYTFLTMANLPKNTEITYIGDAAGRKDDHADSDRAFAYNIRANFETPEQFLGSSKSLPEWNPFNPNKFIYTTQLKSTYEIYESIMLLSLKKKLFIILVGPPGSGKSFFCQKRLPTFVCINQDVLKTKTKCLSEVKKAIALEKNIVIDRTNPDPHGRREFIDLAASAGYTIVSFVMNVTIPEAKYLDWYRNITTGRKLIPNLVYCLYQKKYVYPTLEEGFACITRVPLYISNPPSDDFRHTPGQLS